MTYQVHGEIITLVFIDRTGEVVPVQRLLPSHVEPHRLHGLQQPLQDVGRDGPGGDATLSLDRSHRCFAASASLCSSLMLPCEFVDSQGGALESSPCLRVGQHDHAAAVQQNLLDQVTEPKISSLALFFLSL